MSCMIFKISLLFCHVGDTGLLLMNQPIGCGLAAKIVRHHQQWNFAKECSMHHLLLGRSAKNKGLMRP